MRTTKEAQLMADLYTIALAAGLGADATAAEVAARVGEMRGALVEMFAAEVAHSEAMKGWSGSAIPKRARASERLDTAIAAIANLARRLAEDHKLAPQPCEDPDRCGMSMRYCGPCARRLAEEAGRA